LTNLTLPEIKVQVLTASHTAKATALQSVWTKVSFMKVTQHWDYFQLP